MTRLDDFEATEPKQAKPASTDDMIATLQREGWTITKERPVNRRVILSQKPTGSIKIAVASDTHLGSKKQQLTYLRKFGQEAGEWGADVGLHAGDLTDGTFKMHRGMEYEQFLLGADAQRDYSIRNFPRTGFPWWVINGNHDLSFTNESGTDVVKAVCDARDDMTYLGACAARFLAGPLGIDLLHPDGGVPYARSYHLQKAIEQIAADDKPHLMLFGHTHTAVHIPAYRNVEGLMLPCFQAQTLYLQRKRLAPVIGGVLIELRYSKRGLESMTTDWRIYRTPLEHDYP